MPVIASRATSTVGRKRSSSIGFTPENRVPTMAPRAALATMTIGRGMPTAISPEPCSRALAAMGPRNEAEGHFSFTAASAPAATPAASSAQPAIPCIPVATWACRAWAGAVASSRGEAAVRAARRSTWALATCDITAPSSWAMTMTMLKAPGAEA